MEIIVTIIPANVVSNSLYPFFVLSWKPKTRIKSLASWLSASKKYFCFLFIASRTLLQRYAEFNGPLQKDLLACYSFLNYSSIGEGNIQLKINLVVEEMCMGYGEESCICVLSSGIKSWTFSKSTFSKYSREKNGIFF